MEQNDKDVFNHSPPPLIERLARIEGQSNFLSMLAGVEAGADTTADMGALAISRGKGASKWEPLGALPEILEAHVSQSAMYRLPLLSIVWRAVLHEFRPKEKDWPWIRGAIADAFAIIRLGSCKPLSIRAKRFRTDISAYSAMRKLAYSVFLGILDRAEREYRRAMRSKSDSPSKEHNQDTPTAYTFSDRAQLGHFIQKPLHSSDEISDGHLAVIDTHGIGMTDRLGWDERNAASLPVTTLQPDGSGNLLPAQRPADHACESGRDDERGHNRPANRRRGVVRSASPAAPTTQKGAA